jgi:iron-sulfur cluster assembly protein
MFKLTPTAAQQIQQAAQTSGAVEMALRIAAKMDAQGELQYGMGFDEPQDEDMRLDLEGVAVLIGNESQALLSDTLLDFVELEPGEFNFVFIPSNHPSCSATEPSSSGCASGACNGCTSKGTTH